MIKETLPEHHISFRSLFYDNDPVALYFSSLPVLETEHLSLRRFRDRDAADIYSAFSDPDVARYVLWEPHHSLYDSKRYIRAMRQLYRRGLPASWAITKKETGCVIGSIGLMWYDAVNRSAEVGYSLSKTEWNKGYATEALHIVLSELFRKFPLNRIEAQHDIRNPASGHVMEKCGMRKEGILRGRIFNKGEYVDVVLYSVLTSDQR